MFNIIFPSFYFNDGIHSKSNEIGWKWATAFFFSLKYKRYKRVLECLALQRRQRQLENVKKWQLFNERNFLGSSLYIFYIRHFLIERILTKGIIKVLYNGFALLKRLQFKLKSVVEAFPLRELTLLLLKPLLTLNNVAVLYSIHSWIRLKH